MKKMQREPSHNSAMAVMPATAAPDAAASFYKQENEHRASVNGLLLPPDPAPSHSADDRLRSYYLPTLFCLLLWPLDDTCMDAEVLSQRNRTTVRC